MKGLLSYVSTLRRSALALFHRSAPLSSEAAERRERWNETIAEHRKALEGPKKSER